MASSHRLLRRRSRLSAGKVHNCKVCGRDFQSNGQLWMHLRKTTHGDKLRNIKLRSRSRSLSTTRSDSVGHFSGCGKDERQENEDDADYVMDDGVLDGFHETNETFHLDDNESLDAPQSARPCPVQSDTAVVEAFPGAAKEYGRGEDTFTYVWENDCFRGRRDDNPYYPFSCEEDFRMAKWIIESGLPFSKIDELLSLDYITTRPLSFRSAKELRDRVEMLPSPPNWMEKVIFVPGGTTRNPIKLLYRDGLETFKFLFGNPIYAKNFDLAPVKIWTDQSKQERLYTEMMTGDIAWNIQSRISPGETLGLVILSSDKTHLTTMQGDKECHAVYLTVGNIRKEYRTKAANACWIMVGQIPVVKFKESNFQTMLSARLYHTAMDVITTGLKQCSVNPEIMSDPRGGKRLVRTILAAFLADYPEQQTISCTSGNTAPTSLATLRDFGDGVLHELRTREKILADIRYLEATCSPLDLYEFQELAREIGLNGVICPFWEGFAGTGPHEFLAPDMLHMIHKFFQDHPAKWVYKVMGKHEFDRRLQVLQPRVGHRHFSEGVTKFKQHSQKETKDLERIILPIIAGHPSLSKDSIRALRALLDFVFVAQYNSQSTATLALLDAYLTAFHKYKKGLSVAGVRNGPKTKGQFNIKKLEQITHVTRCIRNLGSILQFTTEQTEKAHISHCKQPYKLTNKKDYEAQMCRRLDALFRVRLFPQLVEWHYASQQLRHMNTSCMDASVVRQHWERSRTILASHFLHQEISDLSSSSRAICTESSTWILPALFHIRRAPLQRIEDMHGISRFRSDLGDYFKQFTQTDVLPFSEIGVWWKMKVQLRDPQDNKTPRPPITVLAQPHAPPKTSFSCYNFVLVKSHKKDLSIHGIVGDYFVGQLRLIFKPLYYNEQNPLANLGPLAYVFVYRPGEGSLGRPVGTPAGTKAHLPDDDIELFRVRPSFRPGDNSRRGLLVSLKDIWMPIELVPKFGKKCPQGWNKHTAVELASELYVNSFDNEFTYQHIY